VINGGLSEISGAFPVPPPRDSRERNGKPGHREEATGTPAIGKRWFPSITVIGAMSIIVTTLTRRVLHDGSRICRFPASSSVDAETFQSEQEATTEKKPGRIVKNQYHDGML